MKNTARCIFLSLSIGVICTNAYADGKFYFYHEGVPADIPYQRAFLIFHENTETLILQSKYEISKSQPIDSLGWIVPVPSIPEFTSFDADIANDYIFYMASISTQPRIFAIFWDLILYIIYILIICSVLSIIILVFFFPFFKNIKITQKTRSKILIISSITLVIMAYILKYPARRIKRQSAGADVEIVKAEKAGIYDVKVIKSDNTEAILGWLSENNFEFDVNDSEVFADYISRDWCFVVAKAQPEPGTKKNKISQNGMVAPLVLKFDTEKAIYPTALTASIGTDTQILIYTLCENKLDCKNRLKFETAQETHPLRFNKYFIFSEEEDKNQLLVDTFDNLPEELIICKFKDTLTSEQMNEDIVFDKASDNKPYRKLKIIWDRH